MPRLFLGNTKLAEFLLQALRRLRLTLYMLEASFVNNSCIVKILTDELEMFKIPELKNAMTLAIANKPELVVLDLSPVEFIDSSAIGAFFYLNKMIKGYGGLMVLTNLGEQVTDIMRATHSLGMLKIHDTVENALAAVSSSVP